MRFLTFVTAMLIAVASAASEASALPAPMPESELLQKSDFVGLIRVLSVTCTKVVKDERTGEELPSYSAKAELMYVTKGDEILGHDITITFEAIPRGMLGPWTVYYYPGEMVWTHLTGKDGIYTTTWWNGKGRVVNKPIITELPTTKGETAEVPRRNAQTRN
jgi:hypothetical protein